MYCSISQTGVQCVHNWTSFLSGWGSSRGADLHLGLHRVGCPLSQGFPPLVHVGPFKDLPPAPGGMSAQISPRCVASGLRYSCAAANGSVILTTSLSVSCSWGALLRLPSLIFKYILWQTHTHSWHSLSFSLSHSQELLCSRCCMLAFFTGGQTYKTNTKSGKGKNMRVIESGAGHV